MHCFLDTTNAAITLYSMIKEQRMNEVTQAFELDVKKKADALAIYEEAVRVLVHKDYIAEADNAHTELSVLFGGRWFCVQLMAGTALMKDELLAEANVAFNYANIVLGVNGKYKEMAKRLVSDAERVSDAQLHEMQLQMHNVLTCTTAEDVEKAMAEN